MSVQTVPVDRCPVREADGGRCEEPLRVVAVYIGRDETDLRDVYVTLACGHGLDEVRSELELMEML